MGAHNEPSREPAVAVVSALLTSGCGVGVSEPTSRCSPLQTLVVLTLHGSALHVGVLNAAHWLSYLLVGIVVGASHVRQSRRAPAPTPWREYAANSDLVPAYSRVRSPGPLLVWV